jgi:hypothetical protein
LFIFFERIVQCRANTPRHSAKTARFITTDTVLNRMRASPGSACYLGALAVDAWFANDLPDVKTFLIKGLFLDALLIMGPHAMLKAQDHDETRSLARRLQLILRDGCDHRTELKRLTRGACHLRDLFGNATRD